MFSFRQAFALVSVSIAFHLVMTAPILIPTMEPTGEEGGGGVGQPMTENRKIDGKDVKLTLLPGAQVLASSAYSLSGGWDGNPLQDAIVRIWKTQDTKLLDTIETSVGFLKDPAVGLLYHSEKNTLSDADPKEYEYITVTKAMRQNYPTQGAPELA